MLHLLQSPMLAVEHAQSSVPGWPRTLRALPLGQTVPRNLLRTAG